MCTSTEQSGDKSNPEAYRSSVGYWGGERLSFRPACCSGGLVELGGSTVRRTTGSPIAMNDSSCPGGEHMHSSCAGRSETLRKACGALAGMLRVSPVHTTEVAPRKVTWAVRAVLASKSASPAASSLG